MLWSSTYAQTLATIEVVIKFLFLVMPLQKKMLLGQLWDFPLHGPPPNNKIYGSKGYFSIRSKKVGVTVSS